MSFKAPSKGKVKLQMLSRGDDLWCKLAGSQCELKPCLYSRMQMSLRKNHPKVRNNPSPRFWIKDNVPEIDGKGSETKFTTVTATLGTQFP